MALTIVNKVTLQNRILQGASNMTPAGLEPAIPGSVGRCLIHWATGPDPLRWADFILRRRNITMYRCYQKPKHT